MYESKIYTKKGDQGRTELLSKEHVSKSHLRLDTYGTVDELNSWLGLIRASLPTQVQGELDAQLIKRQNEIFLLASRLATTNPEKLPNLEEQCITELEQIIDQWTDQMPLLQNFVVPGSSLLHGQIHVARTICRRAERLAVKLSEKDPVDGIALKYLNRLGDYLFVMARFVAHLEGHSEAIWKS